MLLERAVDAIVLGIIGVLIFQTPSDLARGALLVAAALLVLGWVIAWRRRK